MRRHINLLLLAISFFALTSCGRHIALQRSPNKPTTYLCPMHKDYISSQPGKCPKCGMLLVTIDDYLNSKSFNQNQNRIPDNHTGIGGNSGGHAGHH